MSLSLPQLFLERLDLCPQRLELQDIHVFYGFAWHDVLGHWCEIAERKGYHTFVAKEVDRGGEKVGRFPIEPLDALELLAHSLGGGKGVVSADETLISLCG